MTRFASLSSYLAERKAFNKSKDAWYSTELSNNLIKKSEIDYDDNLVPSFILNNENLLNNELIKKLLSMAIIQPESWQNLIKYLRKSYCMNFIVILYINLYQETLISKLFIFR